MSLASISIIDCNIINSTKTHQYVGQGKVDHIDICGGLHVGVGEDNHQHDDVAHHSHQEDDQVAQVHQGLDNREEDVSLILVTYWSMSDCYS